jgi:putative SOS response-associated peptidase YedK
MCGRFVRFRRLEALKKSFPIDVASAQVGPSYNVSPTQEILAITRHDRKNHLEKLHWGLVPFWAKDTAIGSRMINARSETVDTRPSFKTAFKWRRCLILADGYFEWKGEKGRKQPMFITLPDGRPFAFAGLWETWDDRGKEPTPYRSCTILTRESSESVMPIHNRMPVILKPEAFGPWLSRGNQDVKSLLALIHDNVYTTLRSYPVSKQVNSVKVNRPGNIRPLDTRAE